MARRRNKPAPYRDSYRARTKPSPIPWLLAGVVIGFIISGIFYVRLSAHNSKESLAGVTALSESKQIKSAASTKVKHPNGAKYDFYDLLPSEQTAAANYKEKTAKSGAKFTLEVAKFTNYREADALKAKIALMGYHALIANSSDDNHHKVYLVKAGPFNAKADALHAQEELSDNEITSSLVNEN